MFKIVSILGLLATTLVSSSSISIYNVYMVEGPAMHSCGVSGKSLYRQAPLITPLVGVNQPYGFNFTTEYVYDCGLSGRVGTSPGVPRANSSCAGLGLDQVCPTGVSGPASLIQISGPQNKTWSGQILAPCPSSWGLAHLEEQLQANCETIANSIYINIVGPFEGGTCTNGQYFDGTPCPVNTGGAVPSYPGPLVGEPKEVPCMYFSQTEPWIPVCADDNTPVLTGYYNTGATSRAPPVGMQSAVNVFGLKSTSTLGWGLIANKRAGVYSPTQIPIDFAHAPFAFTAQDDAPSCTIVTGPIKMFVNTTDSLLATAAGQFTFTTGYETVTLSAFGQCVPGLCNQPISTFPIENTQLGQLGMRGLMTLAKYGLLTTNGSETTWAFVGRTLSTCAFPTMTASAAYADTCQPTDGSATNGYCLNSLAYFGGVPSYEYTFTSMGRERSRSPMAPGAIGLGSVTSALISVSDRLAAVQAQCPTLTCPTAMSTTVGETLTVTCPPGTTGTTVPVVCPTTTTSSPTTTGTCPVLSCPSTETTTTGLPTTTISMTCPPATTATTVSVECPTAGPTTTAMCPEAITCNTSTSAAACPECQNTTCPEPPTCPEVTNATCAAPPNTTCPGLPTCPVCSTEAPATTTVTGTCPGGTTVEVSCPVYNVTNESATCPACSTAEPTTTSTMTCPACDNCSAITTAAPPGVTPEATARYLSDPSLSLVIRQLPATGPPVVMIYTKTGNITVFGNHVQPGFIMHAVIDNWVYPLGATAEADFYASQFCLERSVSSTFIRAVSNVVTTLTTEVATIQPDYSISKTTMLNGTEIYTASCEGDIIF